MTTQEAFDQTMERLAAQGKQCSSGYGSCIYAGTDGMGCAVGINLPRELAEKLDLVYGGSVITIAGVWSSAKEHLLLSDRTEEESRLFWRGLQVVHDRSMSLTALRDGFKLVTETFGINSHRVSRIQEWVIPENILDTAEG